MLAGREGGAGQSGHPGLGQQYSSPVCSTTDPSLEHTKEVDTIGVHPPLLNTHWKALNFQADALNA